MPNGQPPRPGGQPPRRRPVTPQQQREAARRRREFEEKRRRALRRYYAFLALLGVLAVALVVGAFLLIRSLVLSAQGGAPTSDTSQGLPASSASVAQSAPASSVSAPQSLSASEPENPNAPADPTLWSLLLANTTHPLPEGYTPKLASIGSNSRNGEQYVDERIQEPMQQMLAAARQDGIELVARSAYRSTQEQASLFNSMKQNYLNQGMTEEQADAATRQWRNPPGTSEHETGLCADIVGTADLNANLTGDLAQREWAVWLKEHAADYGFILRYPEGKTEITGTEFEPWHYRYVGVEDARKIMAQGLTLEEYLGEAGTAGGS